MANFHTNNVVITANNADMLAVLRAMAANIASSPDADYDDVLLDANDAPHAYSRVRNAIDAWYCFAFTPAPIGSDAWVAEHPDYPENELAGNESYAAMAAIAKQLSDAMPGANVSMRVQPSGRPLSDTAVVSMDRFGLTYALRIAYSTANVSNFADVSAFFAQLPDGNYGLAFLHADEYDGYEQVSLIAGVSFGGELGDVFDESVTSDELSASDLYKRAKELSQKDLAACDDLAEIALSFAICKWSEYPWALSDDSGRFDDDDAEALYDAVDIGESSSDHQAFDQVFRAPEFATRFRPVDSIDFNKISKEEIAVFAGNVEDLLKRFPFECEVTGQAYEGRNANIEHLVPGDAVQLKSDWASPYFKGAGIEVHDKEGRRLANLGGYFNPSDVDRITIACLLPHIAATAIEVSPLGAATSGKRRQGQFRLHLEIEPLDLPSVLDEVRGLLSLPPAERVRLSLLPE